MRAQKSPPENVGARLEGSLANLDAARKRGFPWGFPDRASYDRFVGTVKASLDKRKIPSGDVRVHGSAMHNKTPGDIDVAVIVDEATFKKLGAQFASAAKTNPRGTKALASDLEKGKISSANFYPDHDPSVAREAQSAADRLDVQISIVKSGSAFDIGPYLPR